MNVWWLKANCFGLLIVSPLIFCFVFSNYWKYNMNSKMAAKIFNLYIYILTSFRLRLPVFCLTLRLFIFAFFFLPCSANGCKYHWGHEEYRKIIARWPPGTQLKLPSKIELSASWLPCILGRLLISGNIFELQ